MVHRSGKEFLELRDISTGRKGQIYTWKYSKNQHLHKLKTFHLMRNTWYKFPTTGKSLGPGISLNVLVAGDGLIVNGGDIPVVQNLNWLKCLDWRQAWFTGAVILLPHQRSNKIRLVKAQKYCLKIKKTNRDNFISYLVWRGQKISDECAKQKFDKIKIETKKIIPLDKKLKIKSQGFLVLFFTVCHFNHLQNNHFNKVKIWQFYRTCFFFILGKSKITCKYENMTETSHERNAFPFCIVRISFNLAREFLDFQEKV